MTHEKNEVLSLDLLLIVNFFENQYVLWTYKCDIKTNFNVNILENVL